MADANESFEEAAALFYRETGYMAPGKSVPMEMGGEDYDVARQGAWTHWVARRKRRSCEHCGNPMDLHPMTFKTKSFGTLQCSGESDA